MKVLICLFIFFPMVVLCQKMEDIETDSSTIRFVYSKEKNLIYELNRLKNSSIMYLTERYFDTKNTRRIIKTMSLSTNIGVSRTFSNKGEIEELHDFDKGKWIVFKKEKFPFYDSKMKMKSKGDSIIRSIYSLDFLKNHVVWNFDESYTFNNEKKQYYVDSSKEAPNKYLLVYDIYVKETSYGNTREMIQFELDSTGNLIKNDEIRGFERLSKMTDKTFVINYEKALKKVKSFEKDLNDTTKIEVCLKWEDFDRQGIFNGKYWYYFQVPTEIINRKIQGYSSYIEYMYNVYIFDPWTSEFVEMKKMKMVDMISFRCHTNTGLMLDE